MEGWKDTPAHRAVSGQGSDLLLGDDYSLVPCHSVHLLAVGVAGHSSGHSFPLGCGTTWGRGG